MPEYYIDQDGNRAPLCTVCDFWRATEGPYCESCAALIEILGEVPPNL